MIKLTSRTSSGDRTHYIQPDAIARMTEAGASSQWHGIRTIVKTFDGDVLEVSEDIQHIVKMLQQELPQ